MYYMDDLEARVIFDETHTYIYYIFAYLFIHLNRGHLTSCP